MTKPQKIEGEWERATKNALPEMKWRQNLMLMIYEVAITKKMLASDLIDKIIKHEDEAKASERQRCVEACEYGKYKHVISEEHKVVNQALDEAIQAIDQSKHDLEQLK